MRVAFVLLCVTMLAIPGSLVQAQGKPQAAIPLWPEGVPGAIPGAAPEVVESEGRISNVHEPTLTPYLAPGRSQARDRRHRLSRGRLQPPRG